jgi:16S rRNA (cytosine967-C5)-methyltransferase
MNSNRSEGGGRGGHRKDVSPRKEYRKDTYRGSKGKDDSGRKEYRKDRDTYRSKDDSGRKEYRKDRDTYRKDDSERKGYRKDTYRKDDSRGDDRRKDHYGRDDSGRKEYRKDTYRKDDSTRKEYRKDTYRKDDSGRKDYRKDTYRKDDSERKEYRKDTYRKDDSERKEYRKDTYRKDDTRRDDRRGGSGSGHRKDYHRKDGARGDGRRGDYHRSNKGDGARKSDSSVSTRQLVQRILADFDSDPGDPERIADRILARRHIEDRDRRFVFELVYGVLRNRIYLDYVIDKFISDEREPMSDALRRILRIGAYQILYLDRVPDHAAVNETVNLAKRDPNTAPGAGFINAVLRKVISNKFTIELPDSQTDLSGRLSIEFSHPKWMVERWLARYGLGDTKKILAFNNERPAIYLRRKRRDISRPQFEFDMRTLCDAGSGYLNLYYKMNKPLEPENLRILQDGFCSVQSPSSGWVVAMLDLRDGDRVLDMCSAPGGKATLMAELVGDAGFVAACDSGRWKIKMLVEAINAQNLENIYPLVCDSVDPPFSGTFNKVLLDAPCSGSGVLQRHPDGRFVRTAEDIDSRVLIQRELLDSAAKLVNDEGGILVYSTCSLEPEENEHQVKWFLDEHPEFKLDHPPDVIPAMYIDDAACLRITPYKHSMDGMFGARFKKG